MKKISLKKAYSILKSCSGIIVDEEFITFPTLNKICGDGDNIFLEIDWNDGDGYTYTLKFKEKDNQNIRIRKNSILLKEVFADEVEIYPLTKIAIKE